MRPSPALRAASFTLLLACLLSPAPRPGPDSFEMFQLAGSWLSVRPPVSSPGFWPPLWPLLVSPGVALSAETTWASGLNLLLMGATGGALWTLASRLGGRTAGIFAVAIFTLLPAVRELTQVLDARPLGMLLTTLVAALTVEAAQGRRGWTAAVVLAGIAPLARPEGILLPPIVAAAGLLSGRRLLPTVAGFVASMLPQGAWQALHPGRGSYEALFAPWIADWPRTDLVGLFGPGSMDSAYRRFALATLDAGIETLPADPTALLTTVPASLLVTTGGVTEAIGMTGLLLAGVGLGVLCRQGWRAAAGVGLGLLPLAAVAVAPMSIGQSTRTANLLFLLPLAAAAVGLALQVGAHHRRRGRRDRTLAAALLAGLLLAEAHLTPLRQQPPYFIESEEAALLAVARLRQVPPEGGVVAASFSGRSVVHRAGLVAEELPGGWLDWTPTPGVPVLISSVEARSEDAGRALMLLEDPAWRVLWVVTDGDLTGADYPAAAEDRGWYALLHRVDGGG